MYSYQQLLTLADVQPPRSILAERSYFFPDLDIKFAILMVVLSLNRYLATGGNDSIVNLFDTSEWLCARTITACEYVLPYPSILKHGR